MTEGSGLTLKLRISKKRALSIPTAKSSSSLVAPIGA